MSGTITWVHTGDLHMDEADGWLAKGRLKAIVAEVNETIGTGGDFVFLPGDYANHATAEQYRDLIKLLVCDVDAIPDRGVPVAPGRDLPTLGAWPEHGIEGTQLGLNKDGGKPS